ncbi:bifunctional UDP-N-acetylglucosamine diphosphorylase/glucosamine-1-phosphate N-acetyltransferase GlmU [Alsobacter soli]|uniref:bifunctional UDP-N-acetylglucosamine diphosphorylase/glucosamine-1-phosphate N-acetyltransferase GlmU n=1 Tax=Alsobacter soli TaxID=2109933 RepID=UPI0024782449|nr:bifunctional UDP-N-acetylglucosamine diphosphorylase/glucosamine-1-phosphate N-acetyltransferase GlmU [Alsobacter soli]
MATRRGLAIILAAGEGTRMKSATPKVLHAVAGLSMLGHVVKAAEDAGVDAIAVVVGPGREDVAREALRLAPGARVYVQEQRLGTAHAVLAAREAIADGFDDVVVLFADTPLVRPSTIQRMRNAVGEGASVAALGFEARDPTGYGRMVVDEGSLVAIREHKDASEDERRITLCNAGLMAFDGRHALELLDAIGSDNAQGEFYLTDAVSEARGRGYATLALVADEDEVRGVNDRVQLAVAESIMQGRLREAAMRAGVTMVAPETVFLSHDTRIGEDVVIEPNVFFGLGVTVGAGAVIHANCHFEKAAIGEGAEVGPFARLRPGADLGAKTKVGNFCEVKNAKVETGAKINHLSYVGDAVVGAKANVGAGTITCNYDGFHKAKTIIGEGAFIGSNSALVAPVTIGSGAYVGSGSVVTDDVPDDALALGRGRQVVKEGWGKAFREANKKG